jgi:hypothetical protein
MKGLTKYLIIAVLAILAYKWIETNPFSQFANTIAQSAVYYSQAELQQMQAAQIQQNIRRQNEMDNGLGMNMNARIITGRGITDAEQVSSTLLVIGGVVGAAILMMLGALLLIVLIRLTTSTVQRL